MIYLATDHRGYEMKEKIKAWLASWGYEFQDLGAFEYNEQDDYPDFIVLAAEKVSADPENSKGIVLGGSGQGEAIVANKFRGVRAIVYYGGPDDILKLSREHNNANVLSLGASFIDDSATQKAVRIWLESAFSGEERHKRRIEKIKQLEK